MTSPNQIPVIIFLLPFFGTIILPFFYRSRVMLQVISLTLLGAAVFFSFQGLMAVNGGEILKYRFGGWFPPYGIEWQMDAMSALMTLLITSVSFIVLFATGSTTIRSEMKPSPVIYYAAVLLHISALLGLVMTHDLFNLFVFLEVSSLTAYALIATGDDYRGNVASFRYLLIGTVGASFYLLGVGYFYAATGTLNMADLVTILPGVVHSKTIFLGTLLILTGLFIKMGLFPFHGWLPDAYAYASDSASALVAPLMTKTMIYAIIRIFFLLLGTQFFGLLKILPIMVFLGVTAMIFGSIMAFVQTDFKRMLAYSSISHIGLIVLGLGLDSPMSFMGAILHIVNHAVMKAALFLIAASAYRSQGVRDIFSFSKLRHRMPFTLAAFAVAALSMIGVPPFCGFFSKWYILTGAVDKGMPVIAAAIVLSSLLTALYFFKVIEQAFLVKPKEADTGMQEADFPLVFSTGCISMALLVLGIYAPKIVFWGIHTFFLKGS